MISLVQPLDIDALIKAASETPAGCFVEVGVYKGGTAKPLADLAQRQGRKCYLYDTFTGIPHACEWDHHKVGDFSDTSYQAVLDLIPNAYIIKGVFPKSALDMPPIAFAHLDCDQYQSIQESVEYLRPRMVIGGVIWFDDTASLTGAYKAITDMGLQVKTAENGKHYMTF